MFAFAGFRINANIFEMTMAYCGGQIFFYSEQNLLGDAELFCQKTDNLKIFLMSERPSLNSLNTLLYSEQSLLGDAEHFCQKTKKEKISLM